MTKQEFDEMAALVVRLRKDVELHTDALKQSNAHCGKLLVQNEQLHSELVEVRAALASATEQRDSLRRTLYEWEHADTKPHARIDEVSAAVPVCMQCLKERIKTAHAYETGPAVAILTKPLLPADVADHVVPPVLPMCNVCHGCGGMLIVASNSVGCYNVGCRRTMTVPFREATVSPFHPYYGPCSMNGACSHG